MFPLGEMICTTCVGACDGRCGGGPSKGWLNLWISESFFDRIKDGKPIVQSGNTLTVIASSDDELVMYTS